MAVGVNEWKRQERRLLWSRIVRWGIGLPLLLFSYPALGLISPFTALLGAILIAPDVAGFLANSVGTVIWSHSPSQRSPNYDIPESLVARGKYSEAEAEYDRIIEEFPLEVKPHIALINIAVTRLNDGELAARLYERGMAALKDPASKETLTTMFRAIMTRLRTAPK